MHVTFGSVFFHGGCVIAAAVHGTRLVYTLNVYYLSFFSMIVKNNPPQKKTVSLIFLFLGTPSLFLCVLFLIFRESIIIYGAWELRKKNCPNLCYFGHHLVRSRCLTFPSMSFLFPPPKASECTL